MALKENKDGEEMCEATVAWSVTCYANLVATTDNIFHPTYLKFKQPVDQGAAVCQSQSIILA